MRVIKDDNIAFLAAAFGLKQRFHAAFTPMLCFDLADPSLIIPEEEMWKTAKDILPAGTVLDSGMPKAKGEFLVAGNCCAPKGKTVTGQNVTVRVGGITKTIAVFGNRYWTPKDGGLRISAPVPFKEMPMDNANAFGGAGHATNPLGIGMGEITREGKLLRPLPNLENPERLITSPDAAPEPATLLPLAVNHPRRARFAGTYDDAWLKKRWPWYPDDLDSRFFSCALEEQWNHGYFTGSEVIEVSGMHPDYPVQRTSLPRFRMRMFVTKRKAGGTEKLPDEQFIEIETRIDTIWLFPTQRRAVMLFRGLVDTCDDEMSDVASVFTVAEPLDTPPKSAEHYLEEQRRRINRKVEIDKAPIAEAQEKIAAFLNSIPDIKRDLDTRMAAGFGKAPAATSSTADTFAAAGTLLSSFAPLITQGESMADSFRAKYGHLVKIDTSFLNSMKQTLQDVSGSLGPMQEKIESSVADITSAKQAGIDKLAALHAEHKDRGVPDLSDMMAIPPEKQWKESAFAFVQECVRNLENDAVSMNRLSVCGLKSSAIRHAFLGINREKRTFLRKDWGLPEKTPGETSFDIPPGFVIPRFDNDVVEGVAIRPTDMMTAKELLLVAGSGGKPLAMPGFRDGKLFARTGDDLDAVLLQQEVWDFCSVVSLAEPDEEPDEGTAGLIKAAPLFFILLPDPCKVEPGSLKEATAKWQKAFPNAVPVYLPSGKSVIEAREGGVDIRELLTSAIPEGVLEELPEKREIIKPQDVRGGMKLPSIDAAALVTKYRGHADAFAAPIKENAAAQQAKGEAMMREALVKAGLDPDKTLAEAAARQAAAPPLNPFDPSHITASLEQQKNRLQAAGMLTPEIAAKFDKASADFSSLVADASKRHGEGMAKLEEAQQLLEKGISTPEWARDMYAGFGMDPESGACITREQVIERHRKGESMAGMKMDGIDLSGLDLKGINLEKAFCAQASFAGSDLTGANLKRGIFIGADFEKALLNRADLSRALFQKANLSAVTLCNARFFNTMLQETDLTGADFTGAHLAFTMFDQAKLPGARFESASGESAVFMNSDLTAADFSRGTMKKWVYQNCDMNKVRFTSAKAEKLTLLGCTGESLSFAGAYMHKARFIQKSSFLGANFQNATLESACIIDSNLSKSDFRGAVLDNSFISEANLRNARLCRVSARGGRWEKSDFGGADMRGVDLMKGTLRKSRLTGADLTYANLYGVDLLHVKVGKTKFDGANLDKSLLENRVEFLDDDA
jgi:uncharacterized protein YjbI with pentapeptide repeats